MRERKKKRLELRYNGAFGRRLDRLCDYLNVPRSRAIEFAVEQVCDHLGLNEHASAPNVPSSALRSRADLADTIASAVSVRSANGSIAARRLHITLDSNTQLELAFMRARFGVSQSAAIRQCIHGSAIQTGYKARDR
jgi:hypothetical protein